MLHGLGKSIEADGDERDNATAGCLYALCLAINQEAEVELFRHILMPDGDAAAAAADVSGDARGH